MLNSLITRTLQLSPQSGRGAILSLHDVQSSEWLTRLLTGLAAEAQFIGLPEFVARQRSTKAWGSDRPLALTFDDGNKSIRTVVEPVCAKLKIPFTTFVCGEVLRGGPPPWFERVDLIIKHLGLQRAVSRFGLYVSAKDRGRCLLAVLKTWPHSRLLERIQRVEVEFDIDPSPLRHRYMNLEDLAVVIRNPLATIGSHTFSHPILANLSADEQGDEVRRGLEALRELVPHVRYFAYPNGKPIDYDWITMRHLLAAGIDAAVTTIQRPVRFGDNVLQLPRLGISEGDSVLKVELKRALPWPALGDRRELRARLHAASMSGALEN